MRPFGLEWDDYRTGVISAVIANVMSSGERVYTPQDFMPALGLLGAPETETEPDANAMLAKAAVITAALGGSSGAE